MPTGFEQPNNDGADRLVEEDWHENAVVLRCRGEIDMLTAPQLGEAAEAVKTRQPRAVIVDLSEVDFLASAGMSMLIAVRDKVSPEAGFAVVAEGPGTSRPLEIVGLAAAINMHPTLEAALASLTPPSNDE